MKRFIFPLKIDIILLAWFEIIFCPKLLSFRHAFCELSFSQNGWNTFSNFWFIKTSAAMCYIHCQETRRKKSQCKFAWSSHRPLHPSPNLVFFPFNWPFSKETYGKALSQSKEDKVVLGKIHETLCLLVFQNTEITIIFYYMLNQSTK